MDRPAPELEAATASTEQKVDVLIADLPPWPVESYMTKWMTRPVCSLLLCCCDSSRKEEKKERRWLAFFNGTNHCKP